MEPETAAAALQAAIVVFACSVAGACVCALLAPPASEPEAAKGGEAGGAGQPDAA